jgi:hypothetical protein
MPSGTLAGMDDSERKVWENRLRREALRQGWLLVKSRRRDPRAHDYGLYVLVADKAGNRMPGSQASVSEFAAGAGMTLAEVEKTLSNDLHTRMRAEHLDELRRLEAEPGPPMAASIASDGQLRVTGPAVGDEVIVEVRGKIVDQLPDGRFLIATAVGDISSSGDKLVVVKPADGS